MIITLVVLLAGTGSPAGAGDDLAAVRRLLDDPEPAKRASAVRHLAGATDRPALGVVLDTLADEHPYVRRAAAGVLGVVVDAKARAHLLDRSRRLKDPAARAAACHAFRLWADADGRAGLLRALVDRAPTVRAAALFALADVAPRVAAADEPGLLVPDDEVVATVARCLDDKDGRVRAHTVLLLESWRTQDVSNALDEERLRRLGRDPDARVRFAALESSVARGGDTAEVAVLHGLGDAVWSVRLVAAELSAQVRRRAILEALVAHLDDSRRRVASAVHGSLVRLSGIPFEPDPGRWTAWLEGDGKAFDPGEAEPPPASVTRGETVEGQRFLGVPLVSSHVVFVVDASKSMTEREADGRTRWTVVREALDEALGGLLTRGQRVDVNVVLFGTEAEALFEHARPLTTKTRKHVRERIEGHETSGRTALYDGIALALADPEADQVVVLSDGAPSAGQWFTRTDLLRAVAADNRFRRARIDVIAVGAERIGKRWRGVLERIAAESGGALVRR